MRVSDLLGLPQGGSVNSSKILFNKGKVIEQNTVIGIDDKYILMHKARVYIKVLTNKVNEFVILDMSDDITTNFATLEFGVPTQDNQNRFEIREKGACYYFYLKDNIWKYTDLNRSAKIQIKELSDKVSPDNPENDLLKLTDKKYMPITGNEAYDTRYHPMAGNPDQNISVGLIKSQEGDVPHSKLMSLSFLQGGLKVERATTDTDRSSRIMLDEFGEFVNGLSLNYTGNAANQAVYPSGFKTDDNNSDWSLRVHDNDKQGTVIMKGNRKSKKIDFASMPTVKGLPMSTGSGGGGSAFGGLAKGGVAIYGAPVGAIQYFATQKPPPGWLVCDGSAVSRDEYKNLFAAIGITYGKGDGIKTFNLPDLRAMFLRGLDLGRGIDIDRELGKQQNDTIINIKGDVGHAFGPATPPFSQKQVPYGYSGGPYKKHNITMNLSAWDKYKDHLSDEIRPKNLAMLACIKYEEDIQKGTPLGNVPTILKADFNITSTRNGLSEFQLPLKEPSILSGGIKMLDSKKAIEILEDGIYSISVSLGVQSNVTSMILIAIDDMFVDSIMTKFGQLHSNVIVGVKKGQKLELFYTGDYHIDDSNKGWDSNNRGISIYRIDKPLVDETPRDMLLHYSAIEMPGTVMLKTDYILEMPSTPDRHIVKLDSPSINQGNFKIDKTSNEITIPEDGVYMITSRHSLTKDTGVSCKWEIMDGDTVKDVFYSSKYGSFSNYFEFTAGQKIYIRLTGKLVPPEPKDTDYEYQERTDYGITIFKVNSASAKASKTVLVVPTGYKYLGDEPETVMVEPKLTGLHINKTLELSSPFKGYVQTQAEVLVGEEWVSMPFVFNAGGRGCSATYKTLDKIIVNTGELQLNSDPNQSGATKKVETAITSADVRIWVVKP